MKRFYIDYLSLSDNDVCHVWVEAYDKDDARLQVKRDYWDVGEIIQIYER